MNLWSRRGRTYRARPLRSALICELNASQGTVPGFNLAALQAAHAVLIGAGGIGSQVAAAMMRKGIGQLTFVDDDRVELKNLTRQLYFARDVGKFKAVRLAKRLAGDGLFPIKIKAHPRRFQELVNRGHDFSKASVLICGVDNNPSRRGVSAYALAHDMVAIHAAVSRDGNQLYVMVQEPARACWGCAFPQYVNDSNYPCNLPGIIDVLQVVAGFIVFAVDSVVCSRPRAWNVRETYLDGSLPDRTRMVERRPDCVLCGACHESIPVS